MVERRTVIRRGFHTLSSLFVVYYWLPDYIEVLDLTKQAVAVLGLSLIAGFEAYRIHKGWLFLGLRDYERKWIAGYFWGAFGYVIALLVFPPQFAIITILGTTLVDPVLGEMRTSRFRRYGRPVGFVLWCAVAATCGALVQPAAPYFLIPVGAAIAVGVEAVKVRRVDDNFVMNIVPLLCLTAIARVLGL